MIELKKGVIVKSGNFILNKKIETFEEFWHVINTDKSIYARHRMYPTAFFLSWQLRLIMGWIKQGYFWTTIKIIKDA